MQFANNQAKFTFGGMEFVTKLVEGKFPDYNRVIPRNHTNSVSLGRAPLLASLQRTAIMTSDKFKGVRLTVEPGTLRVASNNAEQEEAMDELDIDYGGDTIEIGFNVTYLIDALSNMRSEEHTSELQSQSNLVCRLLLEKKKNKKKQSPRPTYHNTHRNISTDP